LQQHRGRREDSEEKVVCYSHPVLLHGPEDRRRQAIHGLLELCLLLVSTRANFVRSRQPLPSVSGRRDPENFEIFQERQLDATDFSRALHRTMASAAAVRRPYVYVYYYVRVRLIY